MKAMFRIGVMSVSIVLTLSPLITSCSQTSPSPTPAPVATSAPAGQASAVPTATSAVAQAAKPAPTPAAAPQAPARPSGTLKMGVSNLAGEVLDPYLAISTTTPFMSMIYDSLVGASQDGKDIGPVQSLATKWEPAPDGLSWTFSLRKGVKWDQGYGEVTADDVKFSIERTIKEGSRFTYSTNLRQGIKQIVVVDPYTVRMDLNNPMVTLATIYLNMLSGGGGFIYPKKALDALGDKGFAATPIGSGPYRLVKREPGLYLQYKARDDYWGPSPKYDEVIINNIVEEQTRIAMLKRGELDVAEISFPQADALRAAGFNTVEKPESTNLVIYPHNQWESGNPLSKLNVRMALQLAINKQELLSTIFGGKGSVLGGNFPTWTKGGRTDLPPLSFDREKAKQLLADAGYGKGFDLQIIAMQQGQLPLIAQALAGYLEAIGIRAKVTPMENAAWATAWNKGQLSATITPYGTANEQFGFTLGLNNQLRDGGMYSVTKDADSTAMLVAASKAKTVDELASLQGQLQKVLYDKVLEMPLLSYGDWYATSSKVDVKGWNVGGRARTNFGPWQLLLSQS